MPFDSGPLGYPVQPEHPGKPALQLMAEAQERQCQHEQWHEDNPGRMDCPPELSSPDDYADIARGQNLMGAMTFEPGDAFVTRKGK